MKTKHYLNLLFLLFSLVSFSQSKQIKAVSIGLGSGSPCTSFGFGCQTNTAKVQMSFNSKTKELILLFNIDSLTNDNKKALFSLKTSGGNYFYTLEKKYQIPKNIQAALSDNSIKFIRKGSYPVIIEKGILQLTLKLD